MYQYGGIYFDTDVEVIKDMSPIIENGAFMGVEVAGAIAAGLGIGAPAQIEIFKEILDSYKDERFVKSDGSLNLKTVVTRVSEIFYQYGFEKEDKIQKIKDITIYPKEYFCPISYSTGEKKITNNTYSIHHYVASWITPTKYRKLKRKFRHVIYRIMGNSLTEYLFKIKRLLFS